MDWSSLAKLIAGRFRANPLETSWRAFMAVFAVIWLWLAIFSGLDLFVPLALIASGNAFAAWVGFDRYGNLMVAVAILFTAFDLALGAAYGGLLYLSSLDWSFVPLGH